MTPATTTLSSYNSKALTSLALMETSLLTRDYLSSFIPFIATLCLKNNYSNIELEITVKDFKDEFGIEIPISPMRSILSRCVTGGIIKQTQGGQYTPVRHEIQKHSFLGKQPESLSSVNMVINKFIEFTLNSHQIVLSHEEASDMFITFLDEHSATTIVGDTGEIDGVDGHLKRNLYLMGTFIQKVYEHDTQLFEIVRKLAMSYLVASALTFDVATEARVDGFSRLTIYLDTPIVFRLLGLQSDELESSYKELFESFNETIKPKLLIFQHTFDEISKILSDCANWIDNPAYNPLYANPALLSFIEKKFNRTKVELYISKLTEMLNDLGINIDEHEYYHVVHESAQIDTLQLKDKLVTTYKNRNPAYDQQKNEASLNYDIRSIENIVKLWGTKSSKDYTTLRYLFLTNNSTLAYVARKFTADYWWDNKNHKSPCITDYYLGTMIWLSTSSTKLESYSKLKLLADCSAATTLSREVMEKFLDELKQLQQTKGIKDSDYLLLRRNAFEKNYLQNITLNEEDAFKNDTIEQLLEDIKADIQKPLITTINSKDDEISSLLADNENQKKRIVELENEKNSALNETHLEDKHVEKDAERWMEILINRYAPVTFAFFGLLAVIIQLLPSLSVYVDLIKFIASFVSVISVLFIASMKTNWFSLRDKLYRRAIAQQRVKNYKKSLLLKKH
ncbi:hypothetical protein [Paenibacillus sp. 2TAB19]|uniref:hypothetical protein n=1 Tax=Paenibacillus sp. 2TAB19 TaxID=3233003 RepID=UPI003F970946